MTFALDLESAADLPEGELAGLREAVLSWARSVSRLDSGTLEKQIQLRSAQRIPVYEFTLQSLIETRSVPPNLVAHPYQEGMSTAEKPLSHDKIDMWKIHFDTPEDFKEFRETRLVPETVTVKECVECRGQGMMACEICNGDGMSACVECRGRGRRACESCHGLGKSNCLRCNGRGLKEGSKLLLSAEDACPGCKGEGKVVCARCEHGELPCGFCESTGRRACQKCDKTGKRKCDTCHGKGRIASGYACSSEFKVFRNAGIASAAEVPASLINTVFGTPGSAAPFKTYEETFTEQDVRSSALPDALKREIAQLLSKLKTFVTSRSRPVKQRLSVAREEIIRIEGHFDKLELVCWLFPQTKKIVPEKNPFQNLVGASWEQAKKASDAGDWDNAVALANKTLNYDPSNADARQLLEKRQGLIFRGVLTASVAAGATSAVLGALFIFLMEKGLHKAGPAAKAVVVLSILGPLLGLACYPLVRKLPKPKWRLGAAFGGTLAALLLFAGVVRGVVGWDGVRRADEAAFREEFKTKLPMGVSDVYWEADLGNLRDLEERYSKTRVDLKDVKEGIEKQERLKKDFDRLTAQYKQELNGILNGSDLGLQEKIMRLENLQETYKVHSVDVAEGADALAKLREQMKNAPEQKRRSVLRIESSAPEAAPAKAPTRKETKAEAKARKKAAAKASAAKKDSKSSKASSAKKTTKTKKDKKKETKKKKK